MMPSWIALAAAIATSLFGQVLLKAGTLGEGGFLTQLFRWQTIIGQLFWSVRNIALKC